MSTTITTSTDVRVYVACLSSYNNGILHGAWCDAIDEDDLRANIKTILASSPMHDAEEWAIHDYEGFGSLNTKLGENPSIEQLCKVGTMLYDFANERDELDVSVLAEFISDYGLDIDDTRDIISSFEDKYQGCWDSFEAFAENMFDECYLHLVPDSVKNYIDYEKFARDLSYDYNEIDNPEGGVAVFYNN